MVYDRHNMASISGDETSRGNQRHVRPTRLRAEDLSGMTMRDYYPNRNDIETNTTDRMSLIQREVNRLFMLPKDTKPSETDFPVLHHELPTLWAMIEEKKFKYWNPKDQAMMREMIRLRLAVVQNETTNEDAEKQMGVSLAERYLYPKTGGRK